MFCAFHAASCNLHGESLRACFFMKPTLSFVFPSFNRGVRLLETIRSLIKEAPANTLIVVLDNASVEQEEAYKKIQDLAEISHQLKYYKNSSNVGFEGNFLKAFKVVNTNYLMFLSDEDTPNLDFVHSHADLFRDGTSYGAIRPSISAHPIHSSPNKNTFEYEDQSFSPSLEALCHFGLTGNYVSGAIYNSKLIRESDLLSRLEENCYAQRFYPHLYLNSLISTKFNTRFMSDVAAFEGEAVGSEGVDELQFYGQMGALSYGHRLDSFVAMRTAISEALTQSGLHSSLNFFTAFANLVRKYLHLIVVVNGQTYHQSGDLEILRLTNSFREFTMSAAAMYPGFSEYAGFLENFFDTAREEMFQLKGITIQSEPAQEFGHP